MTEQFKTTLPTWLKGTVCPTGRFRVKQGWAADVPISVLQELVRPNGGGRGWWVDVPTVALETADAE